MSLEGKTLCLCFDMKIDLFDRKSSAGSQKRDSNKDLDGTKDDKTEGESERRNSKPNSR